MNVTLACHDNSKLSASAGTCHRVVCIVTGAHNCHTNMHLSAVHLCWNRPCCSKVWLIAKSMPVVDNNATKSLAELATHWEVASQPTRTTIFQITKRPTRTGQVDTTGKDTLYMNNQTSSVLYYLWYLIVSFAMSARW